MPKPSRAAAVSPTALYTGAVWARNGLSHPAFATLEGHLMFQAARPALALARALGGPTLEGLLLSRHRVIDQQLHAAIKAGRVTQVIEIAAGLSPRGWRVVKHYGQRIRYIEADLPGMAARKRALLARLGHHGDRHRVVDIDAFAEAGPMSLAAIADTLDPTQGTAIITEGLINYFPVDAVTGLWSRMATTLSRFPNGLYLSDLHIGGENRNPAVRAFVQALSVFVRGRVHLHFSSADEAVQAIESAGFSSAKLLRPSDLAKDWPDCRDPAARLVRVIVAHTELRAPRECTRPD